MSFALKDVYQSVTNQIITALEAGTPPWVCPWQAGSGDLAPANLSSGRPYRGINVLLLNLRAMSSGYSANRWLTFQQARGLGACVRKGEEGTPVVFFKMLERDGAMPSAANDQPGRKVIPLLRTFTVFNAAQIDGLPDALSPAPTPASEWNACEVAELVLTSAKAQIQHGGDRAFYSPSQDLIQLPARSAFHSAEGYYRVALHELTHWSGHPSRCNRALSSRAHIEAYAFEELVAEMGSAFLTNYAGLPGHLNHASYIDSWLRYLQEIRMQQQMQNVKVGDRVSFHAPGHDPKTGIVSRCNRKTVTVITDDGHQWNVAPVFLSRVIAAETAAQHISPHVIQLPSKQ